MSARSISTGPGPFFITATTPVLPTPVVTSKPSFCASAASRAARAHLLHAQFGMGVKIAVQRHQRRHVLADGLGERIGQRRHGGNGGEEREGHDTA